MCAVHWRIRAPTRSGSSTRTSSAPTSAPGPRCSRRPGVRGGCAAWSSAAGGAAVPLQLGGVLKDWVETPDLDRFRRADLRQTVGGALRGIERYALPEPIREDYLSSYEGDRFAESMRYVRSYPAELPVLRDLPPQIRTPA